MSTWAYTGKSTEISGGERGGKFDAYHYFGGRFVKLGFFIHKRATGFGFNLRSRNLMGISVVIRNGDGADFHSEGTHMAGPGRQQKLLLDKAGQKKKTWNYAIASGLSVPFSFPMSSVASRKKIVELLRALSMNVKVFI
jgi:hypothetical protein